MTVKVTRTVACPDCGAAHEVVDQPSGGVYIECDRIPPPCCQKAVTGGYAVVGMFSVPKKLDRQEA